MENNEDSKTEPLEKNETKIEVEEKKTVMPDDSASYDTQAEENVNRPISASEIQLS